MTEDSPTPPDPQRKRDERRVFIFLVAFLFPIMAVAIVGSYGFVVWLSHRHPDGLRPGGTLYETPSAPPIAGVPKDSGRDVRNYPEQPPVIPHSIRGYQMDLRYNQCLTCHNRNVAPDVGAPMVSVTHYTDRTGQTSAEVTPGRYFCTQCHVPQTDAEPLVDSDFMPIEAVIERETARQAYGASQ